MVERVHHGEFRLGTSADKRARFEEGERESLDEDFQAGSSSGMRIAGLA